MSEKERKIKPGELQVVLASEEVQRRNAESAIQFSQDTRKMVVEQRIMFDALQGVVRNLKSDVDELRRQLSILQQKDCSKGTVSYPNDDQR